MKLKDIWHLIRYNAFAAITTQDAPYDCSTQPRMAYQIDISDVEDRNVFMIDAICGLRQEIIINVILYGDSSTGQPRIAKPTAINIDELEPWIGLFSSTTSEKEGIIELPGEINMNKQRNKLTLNIRVEFGHANKWPRQVRKGIEADPRKLFNGICSMLEGKAKEKMEDVCYYDEKNDVLFVAEWIIVKKANE